MELTWPHNRGSAWQTNWITVNHTRGGRAAAAAPPPEDREPVRTSYQRGGWLKVCLVGFDWRDTYAHGLRCLAAFDAKVQ